MRSDSLDFLKRLLDTPAPSAFEAPAARVWRAEAARHGLDTSADVSGNSYAALPGAAPRALLVGHIDEIGVIIKYIDDDGYLSFDGIGGWDSQVFVGQRVVLLGRQGPVIGVVGKKAIHLMDVEDRSKVSKITDLWIDIGATTRAEAAERVRVGDPGVIATPPLEFPNGRIVSRSLDNRIGAWVVLEAVRLVKEAGKARSAVTAVASTREEISMTGGGARPSAVVADAQVAIVVDVTHATDYPGIEKRKQGDYKLGGGPIIARGASISTLVSDALVAAAEAEGIPYSMEAIGRDTHTDAEAIFNAHRGVATGLVSVPNRYMHSPNEMMALADLEATARLLAAFCARLAPGEDFVPR